MEQPSTRKEIEEFERIKRMKIIPFSLSSNEESREFVKYDLDPYTKGLAHFLRSAFTATAAIDHNITMQINWKHDNRYVHDSATRLDCQYLRKLLQDDKDVVSYLWQNCAGVTTIPRDFNQHAVVKRLQKRLTWWDAAHEVHVRVGQVARTWTWDTEKEAFRIQRARVIREWAKGTEDMPLYASMYLRRR